jgi:hypothetical protein
VVVAAVVVGPAGAGRGTRLGESGVYAATGDTAAADIRGVHAALTEHHTTI